MFITDLFRKLFRKGRAETGDAQQDASGAEEGETPVDISQYEGHFALRAKGKGYVNEMLGKIVIVAFLIQEEDSAWTDKEIESFREVLEGTVKLLTEQANLPKKKLQITYALDVVPVQLEFDRDNHAPFVKAVLQQYEKGSSPKEYQEHFNSKFNRDSAPLVFVFNKRFRSYAIMTQSAETSDDEYSFVSFDNDTQNCIRALVHEVLHQYGAVDYYYPDSVKEPAEELFPGSIMASGLQIDPLTRYLIGWDSEPASVVGAFLERTKDITIEEIEEARRKNHEQDY